MQNKKLLKAAMRLIVRACQRWVRTTGGKTPMPKYVDARVAALDGYDPFTGEMSRPPDPKEVRRSLAALFAICVIGTASSVRAQGTFVPISTDDTPTTTRWACAPVAGEWTCAQERDGTRCVPVPDGWSCKPEAGESATLPIDGALSCREDADGTLFCPDPLPFFYGFMVARAPEGSWVVVPVPDGWLPRDWLPEADGFVAAQIMSDGSRLYVKEDAFLFWWGP